jgi:hypothetical protein
MIEKKTRFAHPASSASTLLYPVWGSVACALTRRIFLIALADGKKFNGHADCASRFGGGSLSGELYADDIAKLCKDTVRFEYLGTGVDLSMAFFDAERNLLGFLQANGVDRVTGTGGGAGSWS